MSQYCDNHTDCRRTQILEYFGEIFDRKKCIENKQTLCDNCIAFTTNAFELKDITQDAVSIVKGVRELNGLDVTLLHVAEVLKGSMNSKVVEKQHNNLQMHGLLSGYKKNDIERIIRKLIFDGYLKEDVKILQHTDTVASYVKIGAKASSLLNGQAKIEFDIRSNGKESNDNHDEDNCDDDGENKKTSKTVKQTSKTRKSVSVPSGVKTATKKSTASSLSGSKTGEISPQNRILLRLRNDLKTLAKRICTDKCIKNVDSIFTGNMIKEMVLNLPQSRDEILKITHFTEAIYLNYKGEDFLSIIRHYSKQLDDLRLLEELENPKHQQRVTSINVNDANCLFDNEERDDDEGDWLSSKVDNKNSNKRNANTSYRKPTKKARNDYHNNDDDDGGGGDGNTSRYFNKNSQYGSYKKKSYFKNKTKKFSFKKKK